MNRNDKSQPGERGNGDPAADTVRKTPSTDMQPEDAGTADSGNEGGAGRANEAEEGATKPTGRTPPERQR